MEASPTPVAAPAVPSVARNSMANPSGIGAGAPVRNFLNENVAGYVKRAMLGVWEARPQHPLTWVGEYLISCDIKYNGAPSEESQQHFIYHKDGIDHLLRPRASTTTSDAPATTTVSAPVEPSGTSTPTAPAADNVPLSTEPEVKVEIHAETQEATQEDTQEAVNGTAAHDSDQEMKDS